MSGKAPPGETPPGETPPGETPPGETPPGGAVQDLHDESAIRRLLAEYCQLLDEGRFDDWIDLFSADIEFVVMGMTKTGHAELRGFIEPSQQADARGKHMISEPWVRLEGDTATVTTDFAWVSKAGAIGQSGRYHDRIVRNPDRWRFQRREIVFTGDQPL